MKELFEWTPAKMLEVQLKTDDDFLKIAETLTRIGISNAKTSTLFQTCHILHKRGKYYIVSFKELFALDGRKHTLTIGDISRRNTIAQLLEEWNMCSIVNKSDYVVDDNIQNLHVIRYSDKSKWTLKPKYKIGLK